MSTPYPSPDNGYLLEHVMLLRRSLRMQTGRDLVSAELGDVHAAEQIFKAPFVLLSHNEDVDPLLTYGNLQALQLFKLSWDQLTAMPSRLTAEVPERQERGRLLATVAARGFIDDYSGIRISHSGQRFRIQRATVWNLSDVSGRHRGQAAMFRDWVML